MDRIQLSQLRDIAIEYLPAAQQHREEIKARPTEDRESQHYARALWRIADETFARPEATAKELAAASLLNGITSYELYDPSDAAPATLYKARGIDADPEKMRATMQQGIANAAKTLANVTGRDIPMVDPMAHCFDAPAVPATDQVDLSLAEVVRINEAAPLMRCTVESLLMQAANDERLLYVALKPHSKTLSVMPSWPNPMYPNPKLITLPTKGVMFVAMMAHYAESLATFGSAEISQYQAGFEGVFDGHYWMLDAPQTVGLDRVYVPRSQLLDAAPATSGTPENGKTAADEKMPQPETNASEQAANNRKNHDIKKERGCRRHILENWDDIEKLHGAGADGRQVRNLLKRRVAEDELKTLKTVRNCLNNLRKEMLIP